MRSPTSKLVYREASGDKKLRRMVHINPGSLSAGILWGDSNDIQDNLKEYMKESDIKENIIEGGAIPKNKRLYEKVKKMMDEIYSKPSAYKSGAIVKKYKELGGEYIEDKKPKNLARWFKEDWQNVASRRVSRFKTNENYKFSNTINC